MNVESASEHNDVKADTFLRNSEKSEKYKIWDAILPFNKVT